MEAFGQTTGWQGNHFCHCSCADPESFVRGGPTLTGFFLVDEGGVGGRIQVPL